MFIKVEAICFDKTNPDCRAIQHRSYEYTLALSSIIKRAEHALYSLTDVPGFGPGRVFAKNMNMRERAECLRSKWWEGCHVLELDASRFDAHVNRDLLDYVEHVFWRETCDPVVGQLLRMQLENLGYFRCRTATGEFRQKYAVSGGRMSGDANTAAGNCIIMGCMLAAFGQYSRRRFSFLCDGDDSVFFHDGDPIEDEDVKQFFRRFGMVMSIEARPARFEEIGFCQSRPVFIDGWVLVRNVDKMMSRLGLSVKTHTGLPRYVKTIALGELSLARGCPVVQSFLLAIIRNCDRQIKRDRGRVHRLAIDDHYRLKSFMPSDWKSGKSLPVSDASRLSFSRAFGISVAYQKKLEEALELWEFDLGKTRGGSGIDVAHWQFPWLKPEEW